VKVNGDKTGEEVNKRRGGRAYAGHKIPRLKHGATHSKFNIQNSELFHYSCRMLLSKEEEKFQGDARVLSSRHPLVFYNFWYC